MIKLFKRIKYIWNIEEILNKRDDFFNKKTDDARKEAESLFQKMGEVFNEGCEKPLTFFKRDLQDLSKEVKSFIKKNHNIPRTVVPLGGKTQKIKQRKNEHTCA